jgi:hypothetical protein
VATAAIAPPLKPGVREHWLMRSPQHAALSDKLGPRVAQFGAGAIRSTTGPDDH